MKKLLAMITAVALIATEPIAGAMPVYAAQAEDILITEDAVDAVYGQDTVLTDEETVAEESVTEYIDEDAVADTAVEVSDIVDNETADGLAEEAIDSDDGVDVLGSEEDEEYSGPDRVYSLDGFSIDPEGSGTYTGITTALEMYQNLASDGDVYLRLDADVDDMLGDGSLESSEKYYEYWCVMGTGKKVLDLNGHRFSISYNLNWWAGMSGFRGKEAKNGSTLLKVGPGTSFVLCDSEGDGSLHYDARLKETSYQTDWYDVRNILEVNGGDFVMNGGRLDAGRSQKFTSEAGKSYRRQVHGNGLIIGAGSNVTINGGKINGRGFYFNSTTDTYGNQRTRCGAINIKKETQDTAPFRKCAVDNTTSIIINDGEFEGYGCADVIAGIDDSNYTCFKAIRGGYYVTDYLKFVDNIYYGNVHHDDSIGSSNFPLRIPDLSKVDIYINKFGKVKQSDLTNSSMKYADNDVTISPKDTFYGYGMSKVSEKGITDINSYAGLSSTYDREESASLRADYVSIWPAGNVDNPYPEGEGAPKHNIYYDWQIYDNSGNKIHPKISKFYYNTNKPDIYLSDLFNAPDDRFEYGKTYTVRCYITETYEGQYSYESQAVCEGKIRLVHYCPELNVDFEVVNNNGNLVIIPTADSLPKGDYNCEAIVINKDTGYKYYNAGIQLKTVNGSKGFFISAAEMARSKVGAINLEVEIRVYINTEDDEGPVKQYISKSGQFKKAKKIGYLPKISCAKDNKTGDKDNANGSVRVDNNVDVTLSSGITSGNYTGDFYWVDSNGTKKGTKSLNLDVKASGTPAGDGYWRTAIDVDGTTYLSSNGINVSHDEEEIISFTVEPSEYLKKKVITSTTNGFDLQDAITADFRTNGALVNTREFRWILVSAPDPGIRTGEWNYKGISEKGQLGTYTYYQHKFNFSMMFSDPRTMVSGDYVLGCQLIDGSKVVAYKEVTIPITVKVDKIQAKAKRNGSVYNPKDGYIYVPEGESADFEIWADDCFTRIGCLDTVSLDDFTPGTINLDDGSKIVIGADNGKGVQNVTYTYSSGAETSFKVVHPITEFAIDSVTAPVVGQKVSDAKVTVPTGANYKASVRWLTGSSDVLTEKFVSNNVYTAVVTIIPNAGVVMPVKFEGNATSLDNDPVRVKAKFAGETDYRYLSASNTIDGFVDDDSQFTTSTSDLPLSDGTNKGAYQITYMTYPRLTSNDFTYIDRLGIDFDTNLEGKGTGDVVFAYDPDDGIDTSAMSTTFKTSGGDTFTKFEADKTYTCTLTNLFANGNYRFADGMTIYVNGQPLKDTAYSFHQEYNHWLDSVNFSFTVEATPVTVPVSSLTVTVPAPVAGAVIENQSGDLVPDDPDNSPGWYALYFKDANGNGKKDADENDFTADGGKFVAGSTYGVDVVTYGNDKYTLGDGFTITCNGETKTATIDMSAWTEFMLPEPAVAAYTVHFDANGKEATGMPADQPVAEGGKATAPTEDPVAEGYTFNGWYEDSACSTVYDFGKTVTADLTLYASWTKAEDPVPLPEPLTGGKSALDPVPDLEPGVTTDLYLVKGQKFNIGQGWYIDKNDKVSKKKVSISKKGAFKAKAVGDAVIKCGAGATAWSVNLHISTPKMTKKSLKIELTTPTEVKTEQIQFEHDPKLDNVYWFSSNPDVVTVDVTGRVTTVGKGSSVISAYINGSAYKCKVTVKEKAVLQNRTLHMAKGTSKTISIKGLKKPVWDDSVKGIVTIKNNKVTAVEKGETELSFTQDGTTYKVKIYVDDLAMDGVGLKAQGKAGSNKYLIDEKKIGDETKLSFTNATQPVIFKSSKADIAFIDENWNVVIRGTGKAKFTTKVDGKTITINVTVKSVK